MDLPLELLSMGVSAVFSGVLTIWSQSIKAKQAQHTMLLGRAKLQQEIYQKAREFQGSQGFQFTRRTIALSCVFAIVILPKLLALVGIPVTIGWTQVESGFWFWSEDETKVVWRTVEGLALTPWDTHLVATIIGFYFGNSIVKNS